MRHHLHLFLLLLLSLSVLPAAQAQSGSFPPADTRRPLHEVRAVWLTTLSGLDWPRRPATTEAGAEQQRQELCEILDRYREAGINTVLFQARIRSTTAYPSALEPWDEVFTGTAGKAPPYDPLRFVVEECHRRNMECHAWVVAFPICSVASERRLGHRALPRMRPELCRRCGDRWMMDPGVPGTAEYLADICHEIATNYDVDGIHLDYIRYPEKGIPFEDTKTFRKYGHGRKLKEWRTENVTRCVRRIHETVKAVRPWIKVSCSPVGKHADLPRQSSYGWNARDAVSQDAQTWLREGWMDLLFPMMYFDGRHFYPFALDWKENAAGRPVAPGLGIYFLSPSEKDWDLSVIRRQLNFLRDIRIGGEAFFRSRFLTDNVKGLYDFLAHDFYAAPALLPPMTWADSTAPPAPHVSMRRNGSSLHLRWQAITDETPVRYNLYRTGSNGLHLLRQNLRDTSCTVTPALPSALYDTYAVTALDAYGNESPLLPARIAVSASSGPAVAGDTLCLTADDLISAVALLLTDMQGRTVLKTSPAPVVDISRLPAGLYRLSVLRKKDYIHRLRVFRKP